MTTMSQSRPPENDRYYEALVSRDRRFDGHFFVGVKTTGVYCRPICPARTPKPKNCNFYRAAAEAEQAGFRPCKRCRPETAPASPAWLGTAATTRRALRLIAEGALNEGSVAALANRLGVGERHLRRLFDCHIGASPQQVAATQRLHLALQLLVQTALPMPEIAAGAGYASLRRFNATFKQAYGAPPTDIRRRAISRAYADGPAPITLMLGYRTPYDWDAVLAFLAARAIPGVEQCAGNSYTRTIEFEGQQGTLRIRNEATKSALIADLWIGEVVNLLPIVQRLRSMFDVDADPDAVRQVLGADRHLAPLVTQAPGLRLPGCWDPFELVIRAIVGQQITVTAARTIVSRLVERYGRPLSTDMSTPFDGKPHLFPDSHTLATADIHKIGMPGRRVETLRSLSQAVAAGTVDLGSDADGETLHRQLVATAGIGKWTAGYVQLRALKDPDAFPPGDIALLRAAQSLGIAQTQTELQQAAEAWRPWRAYAVAHLWRSLAK